MAHSIIFHFILGAGGHISVFEALETAKLKTKFEVFENAVIHGIIQNREQSRMCVFGGRNVAVLSIDVCPHHYRFV